MANEIRIHALCFASLLCLWCAPRNAFAQSTQPGPSLQPAAPRPFRLEALGGMGFGNSKLETGETLNTFGPLVSIRAAYALSFGANIAIRAEHFFGSSSSYPLPLVARVDYHRRADFLGADLGFDIHTSHAIFRPYLGLGAMMLSETSSCSPVSGSGFDSLSSDLCTKSESSKYPLRPTLAPGLSMALLLGRFYVILEPRFYYLKGTNGFVSTAGLGLSL